jgi:GNAT superfamily N-acetyltransferase
MVERHFRSTRLVTRGRLHDAKALPGLVAEWRGVPSGLLLYRLDGRQIEIVVLITEQTRRGMASRLVAALRRQAGAQGCRRIWLVTTNDNQAAIAFYRATGWQQVAIHRGAVSGARRLKPEIPQVSPAGVPIEDEIEFAVEL